MLRFKCRWRWMLARSRHGPLFLGSRQTMISNTVVDSGLQNTIFFLELAGEVGVNLIGFGPGGFIDDSWKVVVVPFVQHVR